MNAKSKNLYQPVPTPAASPKAAAAAAKADETIREYAREFAIPTTPSPLEEFAKKIASELGADLSMTQLAMAVRSGAITNADANTIARAAGLLK